MALQLTLDHVILRAADPAATLAELVERTGAPVLVPAHAAGAFTSGILRASVDIEVLAIGATPPPRVHGYGLGFTADVPLAQAGAELRKLGFPTSAVTVASANGRTWAAVQVHGLLPEPFPAPVSTNPRGRGDRAAEGLAGQLGKIPFIARIATRRAGASMVVVTEYRFDAAQWRAAAGPGPTVAAIEAGTGGIEWEHFPVEPGPLRIEPERLPGVRRITFAGAGTPFTLGDVEFAFSSAG